MPSDEYTQLQEVTEEVQESRVSPPHADFMPPTTAEFANRDEIPEQREVKKLRVVKHIRNTSQQ